MSPTHQPDEAAPGLLDLVSWNLLLLAIPKALEKSWGQKQNKNKRLSSWFRETTGGSRWGIEMTSLNLWKGSRATRPLHRRPPVCSDCIFLWSGAVRCRHRSLGVFFFLFLAALFRDETRHRALSDDQTHTLHSHVDDTLTDEMLCSRFNGMFRWNRNVPFISGS